MFTWKETGFKSSTALNQLCIFRIAHKDNFIFCFFFVLRERPQTLLPARLFYQVFLAGGVMSEWEGSDRNASVSVFKITWEEAKKQTTTKKKASGQPATDFLNDLRMYSNLFCVPDFDPVTTAFGFFCVSTHCFWVLLFLLAALRYNPGLRGQPDQ